MKTLYLNCGMGAAGDMLAAALLELLPNKEDFLSELNSLGIPGVTVSDEASVKCGIRGTHVTVKINGEEETEEMHAHDHEHEHSHSHAHTHDHEHAHKHDGEHTHHHSSMHEIAHIIEDLPVSEKIKTDILAVYSLIAEAESHAHGVPVTEIHFHEVGTMDAVADVTAVCMLMDRLSPGQVVVSPVHVGSGHVKCAHGILPVPAPATAYILRDVPIYGGEIQSELCTPTGAALLKHFATKFGNMPVMRTSAVGYGMGKKDLPAANCVVAMLGDTTETPACRDRETVTELYCCIDDMTAEAIGFAAETLFRAGALDVYTLPVGMKKSRTGTLLCVLCRNEDKENMLRLLFRHTTTLGIRESQPTRHLLCRTTETIHTEYGDVRKKISSGYGTVREKYEYEDLAKLAREQNRTMDEMLRILETDQHT